MLNKRQKDMIALLQQNQEWMIGRELARIFSVTDRTVRNDVNHINQLYGADFIEANVKTGYRLNRNRAGANGPKGGGELAGAMVADRCTYILKELLCRKNGVNLVLLQSEMFVSESSLENDIKQIRKLLEPYEGLRLVRSQSSVSLQGDETQKRKLYKDLLEEELQDNFFNLDTMTSLYKDFDLIGVKNLLQAVCREHQYHIREMVFTMLIMQVGISIERIMQHNYVQADIRDEELQDSVEYRIAREFFVRLADQIHIPVIEDEIILLTLLLVGKTASGGRKELEKYQRKYPIEDWLEEVLEDLRRTFDVDFTDDYELKNGLKVHILSFLERHVKQVALHNMYLQELKHKYPLIFEMGVRVSDLLSERISIPISEDEIAYITLHLGAAYIRKKCDRKYRTLLIHPHSKALSSLFLEKILSRFGDRIDIVQCLSFFEKAAAEAWQPELILTTLPLAHELPVPTVQISLFLNNHDESKIFQTLNVLDRSRSRRAFAQMMERLVKKEFFYTELSMMTAENLIVKMCDDLYAGGYVGDAFKENVLRRERMSATSFGQGLAVPHSINEEHIHKSVLSIGILEEPLVWGEYEVRFVILFAIHRDDHGQLRILFDWLSTMISSPEQFARLLAIKSCEEFVTQVTALS